MTTRYDCRDPASRVAGIDAAVTAARAGELIVLPTDTVYGIGADAFIPASVTTLLAAKRRPCSSAPRGPRRRWSTTSGRSGRT
jgi:L-threonylcarbamoyladenylate synthase